MDFVFIIFLKQIFLGTRKFGGAQKKLGATGLDVNVIGRDWAISRSLVRSFFCSKYS